MSRVLIVALLGLVLSSSTWANGRQPCDRGAGGISHCRGDKFVCNNGTISQSKKVCVDLSGGSTTTKQTKPKK